MAEVGYGIIVPREKFYNILANYYGRSLSEFASDRYAKMEPEILDMMESDLEEGEFLDDIVWNDPLKFFEMAMNNAIPVLEGLLAMDKGDVIFVGNKIEMERLTMKPIDEIFSKSTIRKIEDQLINYGFVDYLPTFFIGYELWLDELVLKNKNRKLL